MDCIICFCPIELSYISCYNSIICYKKCQTKICQNCAPMLIENALNNNLLPICPANGCKSLYPLNEIKKLGNDTMKNYYQAIYNYLRKDNGEEAQKKNEYKKMLEKLRNERKVFIETHFPISIYMVANIVYQDKLAKLERNKVKRANEKIQNCKKMCFNLTCRGYLYFSENKHICTSCSTEFCKKCEKPLEMFHICKKDDIESVTFINSLVKCPKCQFPIQKSEGCRNMTCSNCSTNFDYITGNIGGGGSFNTKIETKTFYKMSHEFNYLSPDLMSLLLEFESKFPSTPNKNYLNTLSHIYHLEEDKEKILKNRENLNDINNINYKILELEKKVVNEYINYNKLKYKNKKYNTIASNIELHLHKKDINKEFLTECVKLI